MTVVYIHSQSLFISNILCVTVYIAIVIITIY